jgi:hypothetical protein
MKDGKRALSASCLSAIDPELSIMNSISTLSLLGPMRIGVV